MHLVLLAGCLGLEGVRLPAVVVGLARARDDDRGDAVGVPDRQEVVVRPEPQRLHGVAGQLVPHVRPLGLGTAAAGVWPEACTRSAISLASASATRSCSSSRTAGACSLLFLVINSEHDVLRAAAHSSGSFQQLALA